MDFTAPTLGCAVKAVLLPHFPNMDELDYVHIQIFIRLRKH